VQVPTGNTYDKYHSTNPIARYLMTGFLKAADDLLAQAEFSDLLEIGVGEGELLRHILQRRSLSRVAAFDIGGDVVRQAKVLHPDAGLFIGDAERVPLPSKSFDLVVACEVLEHVPNPYDALREMARLTRRSILVSVPREPLWRVLNIARGYYLPDWGNTPGHVNHWNSTQFVSTVAMFFNVREVRCPLPWTMILADVKNFEVWNGGGQ